MKKIIVILLTILLIICVGAEIYLIGNRNSPQRAMIQTVNDVNKYGVEGLKMHVTDEVADIIDKVSDSSQRSDKIGITDFFADLTQDAALSFMKKELDNFQWSIKDILKGKKNAEVLVGFNYKDMVVGTIHINMVYQNREWKISGIDLPSFEKIEINLF